MLKTIRQYLKKNSIDAWVIYDFASSNPAFVNLIGKVFTTRKCFAIIDAEEKIKFLCHIIDVPAIKQSNRSSEFEYFTFRTWQELDDLLAEKLSNYKTIMMEISENGLLPRSSYVDYGTVSSVKRFVPNIVSSADLFQVLSATFSGESLELHKKAALTVDRIKNEAFAKISRDIKEKGYSDEYEIQQFICDKFRENGMVTDSNPIVAIGENANSPHYEPTLEQHSKIKCGDLVLIDLWAKYDTPLGIFADITWMGYVGKNVPEKMQQVFEIVKKAIDLALEFLEKELPRRKVYGYEVDDICNGYISSQGYGQYIVHRTGHSISLGDDDHGVGVNIDNFETHDTRSIINNIAFSLEPGIYMPEFGIREEIDVYISEDKPHVFTPRQKEIVLL